MNQSPLFTVATGGGATPFRSGLEYPACPLCRSQDREFAWELSAGYRLARCLGCGVHYLYPRLTEEAMQLVYQDPTYFQGGQAASRVEAVFDATSPLPRIVLWRDLTHLGRGYSMEMLGANFSR